MKLGKRLAALALSAACALMCLTSCGLAKEKALLDPENPTTVTIWNYYNGDQLTAFEALVNTFNDTVGAEQGIVVVAVSQGSIDNLANTLLDAVNGKAGAPDVPSAAALYAETAYILNTQDAIVPLDAYFTQEELNKYVPGFLEGARLTQDGPLMMMPVSKSTEVYVVNTTDWEPFAQASGIAADSVDTYEKLVATAQAYYDWTDGLTPDVANDGKALYGRDSVSNYVFVGARQLGHEIFRVDSDGKVTVDMDKDTFRTLWDNYYIPYINGYFDAAATYRSEDIKTGTILSMMGSSSGTSYIPTAVTSADDVSHDISITVNMPLHFANGEAVAVQQGADYCVLKTNDAEQLATMEFLKWFTDAEQNIQFSISSGYSPVTLAANSEQTITQAFTVDSDKSQNMLNALLISAEVYTNGETYCSKPFAGSKDERTLLGGALEKTAADDRAAVEAAMAAGETQEQAVAPYCTDAYFDAWFDSLCTQVKATIG